MTIFILFVVPILMGFIMLIISLFQDKKTVSLSFDKGGVEFGGNYHSTQNEIDIELPKLHYLGLPNPEQVSPFFFERDVY
jgi:hypothetical protein